MARDRSDGITQTAYSADSRLRVAITGSVELQLAAPLYARLTTQGAGEDSTIEGLGDTAISLKVSLPSGNDRLTWAALATVSLPTARSGLGNDSEQYSLGATVGWMLSDTQSLALYANVDLLGGDSTWTLPPDWSFSITDTVAGYLEAGFQHSSAADSPDNDLAGGGLTWMVTPNVQLDAYGLVGLTQRSTDLIAGCGISVFFK